MVLSSHKPKNLRLISAIALAVAFFITLSGLWSLHADSLSSLNSSLDVSLDNADPHQWQQPFVISDRFPERISANDWQFDYEVTEQALLKIKQTKSGELILNAGTAKVLEDAVSKLPSQMKQDELRRIEFLVTKGLPGRAGQQLASIFTKFYYYQQALNSNSSTAAIQDSSQEKTQESTVDQEQSFKQMVLLQKEYLGEDISEQFFGRQNRLNQYLYARKAINDDLSLNSAQKQQQLSILQDRFKANEQ